jgi:hypothetical protein
MFAIDAQARPYYLCTPDPDEFLKEMTDVSSRVSYDAEVRHIKMDDLMCKLLEQLGYSEAVKVFRRSDKWYG